VQVFAVLGFVKALFQEFLKECFHLALRRPILYCCSSSPYGLAFKNRLFNIKNVASVYV